MDEIDSIILFLHDKTSKKHLVEKYNKLRKQLNGDIPRIMEAVSNGVTVEISPVQSQKKVYNKSAKPSGINPSVFRPIAILCTYAPVSSGS